MKPVNKQALGNLIYELTNYVFILAAAIITNILYYPYRQMGTMLLLIDLSMSLLLYGLFRLFKHGKALVFIIISLSSLYSFVQSIYHDVFQFFFSFSILSIIAEFKSVSSSLLIYLRWHHLLFLLPPLLIVILGYRKKEAIKLPSFANFVPILTGACIMSLAIAFFLPRVTQYNVQKYDWQICLAYDAQYSYKIISKNADVTNDELMDFNEKYSSISNNQYTGIFENCNLIMIMCESLDDEFIFADLTPNLFKMKEEGLSFSNYHAPLYEYHTSDTEFLTLTGQLPSLDYGPTFYNFATNSFPSSLPNLFKERGYSANSYHSWIENYYNRKSMHSSLGFDNYYGAESLGFSTKDMVDNSDIDLFDRIPLDDEPFFKFIITLSSHGSYGDNRKDIIGNLEIINSLSKYDNYSSEIKGYIASTMILDQGIGILLDKLDARGKLANTVIVLYGDHVPYVMSAETKDEYITNDTVPLIIYGGGIEGKEIDKLCCTSDLFPTITNMFGIDTSDYYKAGIDILSEEKSTAVYLDKTTYGNMKSAISEELYHYSQGMLINDFYEYQK